MKDKVDHKKCLGFWNKYVDHGITGERMDGREI